MWSVLSLLFGKKIIGKIKNIKLNYKADYTIQIHSSVLKSFHLVTGLMILF